MDLWIRSQDKKSLILADGRLIITRVPTEMYEVKDGYRIECNYYVVGIYKTEKRALEVLDEIHKVLEPKIKVTTEFKKSDLTGNCNWIDKKEIMQFNTYVYEMPEK